MTIFHIAQIDLNSRNAEVIHTLEIVKGFLRENDRVVLFTGKGNYPEGNHYCDLLPKIPNFHIVSKPLKRQLGYRGYLQFQLSLFFAMLRWLRKMKPEFLYVRYAAAMFTPYIFSKIYGTPMIIEINGIMSEEVKLLRKVPNFILKILEFWEKLNCYHAKKIITVTPEIRDYLVRKYSLNSSKIAVIPNGVNTELFKPLDKKECRKKLHLNKKGYYFGFIGNLAPWEGIDTLLRAFHHLKKENSNLKLIIVGDGKESLKLKDMIDKLELEDKVFLLGSKPYSDIPWYISACDILMVTPMGGSCILSGLSPLKLYEAFSCSRPVIATQIKGLEVVEEIAAGITVPLNNPQELAKAITKILSQKKLWEKMGNNGRKYVEKNHHWEKISQKVREVCLAEVIN